MIRTQGTAGELGEVKAFGGNFAPGSYALAQGQILSIAQNTALYNVLGTTYGGNGTTTFALPDLRGRTPVHPGQGAGLSGWALGQQRGSTVQTLTVANLPEHAHALTGHPEPLTDAAGAGAPFSLWKPSLGMSHAIAVSGSLPSAGGAGPIVGRVKMFAGTNALVPAYTRLNGQLLVTANFPHLHSVIGDTYGGNGSINFALPDLRGRAAMGAGTGPGLTARAMGEALGEESATLSPAQMPMHVHGLPYDPPINPATTGSAGGTGVPIDVVQPSLGLRYIIATQGDYPLADGTIPTENAMLGEIALFAGAGDTPPVGWMFAEGQPLSVSENLALASILGNAFGGDATTTIRLPDLRGRIAVGVGQGPGLEAMNRGQGGGFESVTLVPNNLAMHSHAFEAIPVPEPAGATLALLAIGWSMLRRRSL